MTNPTKAELIEALRAFIAQRSDLDIADYGGDRQYYEQDKREIAKQKKAADELLRIIERASYLNASHILEAAKSGRIQFEGGKVDYTANQYWPMEYRAAVASLCSRVIWYSVRESLTERANSDAIRRAIVLNWNPSFNAMKYFG